MNAKRKLVDQLIEAHGGGLISEELRAAMTDLVTDPGFVLDHANDPEILREFYLSFNTSGELGVDTFQR